MNIPIYTTTTYDMTKYKVIGRVEGCVTFAINIVKNFFAGIVGDFGGDQGMINSQVVDNKKKLLDILREDARKGGGQQIIGLIFNISRIRDNDITLTADGTVLSEIKIGVNNLKKSIVPQKILPRSGGSSKKKSIK